MESSNAAACLEALGQTTRLEVFRLLVRAGTTGLPFGEIQERTSVPASTLSHHLATLARCGLITQTRQGRQNWSSVEFGSVRALVDFLTAECCSLDPAGCIHEERSAAPMEAG